MLVLQCQWRDQLRQGEDHMEVLDRQQLSGALLEPPRSGAAMALGAMAIAARAVRDLSVAALIALVEVTAERRRAADRDRSQRLLLLMGE